MEKQEKNPGKAPMKSVVFDLRWHEAIHDLPQYERLEMYEAVCGYAATGKEPDIKDSLKRMALRMIFDQIDDQRKNLEELKEM